MLTGAEGTFIASTTKAAILTLVKPIAAATFEGLKGAAANLVEAFSNRLADFSQNQFEKHSRLNTIVFQHQKSIYDLYIPLSLVAQKDRFSSSRQAEILIDRLQKDLLIEGNKTLITDTAGMGKSTLSKFLFLQCLKSGFAIPFFIELRHLSDKLTVIDSVVRQLNPVGRLEEQQKFAKRHIQRMLKKNHIIFFFDGYDEIMPQYREGVTKDIKELIEVYPKLTCVLTSRPETGLLAFPAFVQYGIRPLKPEESYKLIEKYDEGGGRSAQLIKLLKGGELQAVREFLKNPLLTSLLYRSFEYKQSIPIKKPVFYRQVYDALYDWHDATKDGYNTREKKSGLDIDAFHRVLRVVGFYSVLTGKVEGDTDTVLSWIRKAKTVCNLSGLKESYFLEDLVRAVPLFVKDGDLYRWSHKSLSEYFAAQYICTEGKMDQKKIISRIMESAEFMRFFNVLDQLYDIDNNAFREYLILPMALDFKNYWSSTYKYMHPEIAEADIRLRRAINFSRDIVMLRIEDFKDIKDFESFVDGVRAQVAGSYLSSEMIHIEFGPSSPMFISMGAHCLVIDILALKNDPVVLHPKVFERKMTGVIRLPKFKAPVLVTDDSDILVNSPEHFPKISELVAREFPIPNPERLLAFLNEFQGVNRLSNFADELLEGLQKSD